MSLEKQSHDYEIKDASSDFETEDAPYVVSFYEEPIVCCVGMIDMINSTKIASSLGIIKMSEYYQIFLNFTSEIISKFGGTVIKNIGDCLLYYFPTSDNTPKVRSCLECAIALSESHQMICEQLHMSKLPIVDYRVSIDFGPAIPMRTTYSKTKDLLGPTVNMCSKINRFAQKNQIIVGGDLYQISKTMIDYCFHPTTGPIIGLKANYPVYTLKRRF